jgi:hypothetical protein
VASEVPELAVDPSSRVGTADLPLFGTPATTWPQAPAVTAENRALPLPRTIDGEFDAWSRTENGRQFLEAVGADLLGQAGRNRRVSISRAWESARAQLRVKANNDFRAPAARMFLEQFPTLRGKLEVRRRTAA